VSSLGCIRFSLPVCKHDKCQQQAVFSQDVLTVAGSGDMKIAAFTTGVVVRSQEHGGQVTI
jgi:hypothetical protein